MYKTIAISLLSIALIGVSIWGYEEHQNKRALFVKSENHYKKAFHELSDHMSSLHETIGTTLATSSDDQLSPQMIDIWRLTSQAQGSVGSLPLGLLPFNETEEFLNRIGEFTYQTAARDLEKKPLTKKEEKTLKSLFKQSKELNQELNDVQHTVLTENLKWVDVDQALADGNEPKDNTIMDGFQTVEDKVTEYQETNTENSLGKDVETHKFKNVKGKPVSENTALKKAQNILQERTEKGFEIQKSGKGSDVDAYNITYGSKQKNAHIDISVKGGHPLSILIDRPIHEQKISLNKGEEIAKQFLKNEAFKNMEVFQTAQHDNVGVYSFLYNEDGVRVYSDAVDLKVALDNGEVLGLSARQYYMNHHDRKIKKPKISEKEAKKKVNEDVKIEESHKAIIDDSKGKEVLTYEFVGTMHNNTYRIFINANNGKEEKLEKLTDSI